MAELLVGAGRLIALESVAKLSRKEMTRREMTATTTTTPPPPPPPTTTLLQLQQLQPQLQLQQPLVVLTDGRRRRPPEPPGLARQVAILIRGGGPYRRSAPQPAPAVEHRLHGTAISMALGSLLFSFPGIADVLFVLFVTFLRNKNCS